jgi:hypothetical protein
VWDDDHLVFCDVRSPGTVGNLWVPKTRPAPVTCGFTPSGGHGATDLLNRAIHPNRPVADALGTSYAV